ncbi:MAG: Transcriptional regulator [Lacrimispora sp.]|jgi:AcrR family transcriptional regulator|nr:Transcriptional regulator [Lacrimispora sp.]
MRITKKPEERKQEITEAALKLFLENGYENVSIKDITTRVQIASGLFHYYFHSKEDVLMECVRLDRQRFLDEISAEGYFTNNMDAVDKVNCLASVAVRNIVERTTLFQKAMDLNSAMLVHQIRDYVFSALSDKLTEFIIEGNEEGIFDCHYPQATAEIALFGLSHAFSREQEANPDLKRMMFGEYIYIERDKIRDIMSRLLNMKEPARLLQTEEEKKL